MSIRSISTDTAPRPVAAYSQAIVAGGFLFTAGMIGIDPATNALVDGFDAQAQRALDNIRSVLAAERLGIVDLVKVTLYLTDLTKFGAFNAMYERFLEGSRPARTTVGVSALPNGALIEIDAIAVLR